MRNGKSGFKFAIRSTSSYCTTPCGLERKLCFFRGLSSGDTDNGSHPGAAKKLLTAADYGNNESIDQLLGRTIGADSAWRNLYLGVQANYNNASGDKHIVYPSAGTTMSPQDNPTQAFQDVFSTFSSSSPTSSSNDESRKQLINALLEDTLLIRNRLGGIERDKLDYHVSSLQELESRLAQSTVPVENSAICSELILSTDGMEDLYDPGNFPAICKAQLDLAILAMECNLTKVATIQLSHHTSELIMSRFPNTDMYDPNYDMRSHQASHYGSSHDWESREFLAFTQQRVWFVEQFRYLLSQLQNRPEGDGTMLNHSIVVLCSEVADGNTHEHHDLPIIVAGGGSGTIRGGRLMDFTFRSHGDLWTGLAQAMGSDIQHFGYANGGGISLF